MPTFVTPYHGKVHIPKGIKDLPSFRNWIHFADLPEKVPIYFIQGDVWVECSRSDCADNLAIRLELDVNLYGLVKAEKLGLYAAYGMLWSNDRAEFATVSD